MHSSTCITPLVGGGPRHTPSFRKLRMRVRMTSNMERPQQRRSLVSRSPSRAMAICWKEEATFSHQLFFFFFFKDSDHPSKRRAVPNSPVGFPTSQLEARGAEGHTLLPAVSSSPLVALPLNNMQTGVSRAGRAAVFFSSSFLKNTFYVNSGQNVLEWGSMKQVTHLLLGLRSSTAQE